MELKKILALLLCLTFATAVFTGCGGDEVLPQSNNAEYETGDAPTESDNIEHETDDLSAELDMTVFSNGKLKAAFVDGVCYIDFFPDEETMQAVDQGAYTWDGESGTIDGAENHLTFTIQDGTLVMEDDEGDIYTLPPM